MPAISPRRERLLGGRESRSLSLRIGSSDWSKIKRRAAHDHMSVSAVASLLLEGYAQQKINLPSVQITYDDK